MKEVPREGSPAVPLGPASLGLGGFGQRLIRLGAARGGFLSKSGGVAISNTVARALSLGFSLITARVLGPTEYGVLAYGIAVSGVAAILITNAPASLARFLPSARDEAERTVEFTSSQFVVWTAVSLTVLGTFVVLALGQRWSLVMVFAVLANVAGLAVLYTHRQTQRGLLRFLNIGYAYVGANLIQLVATIIAVMVGWRSAIVMLFIYGLSPIPAVFITEFRQRTGIPFRRPAARRQRIQESARFVLPLTVHSAATSTWFAADVIMVEHFLRESATGTYNVAKTLGSVFILIPGGLTTVLLPMVIGRRSKDSFAYLVQASAAAAISGAGLLVIIALMGDRLVAVIFGGRYANASQGLMGISVGMALYGLTNVLQTYWVGRGRPRLSASSAVAGTVLSAMLCYVLIPRYGLTGAGVGFAAGSVVQVIVLGSATLRSMRGQSPEAGNPVVSVE